MNQAPKKLFYLVSQYPAISHTFILREIRVLREAGFRINTASINAADRPVEAMTAEEQEEARGTYYVKAAGWRGALGAHWEALREDPKRYCTSLFYALSLGGLDLHAILYGFFYFVEAILVGRRMRETQDHHLHVHFSGAAATVGLIVQHHYGHGFSIMVHGPDEFYDAPGNLLEKKYAAASFILTISQYARSQVMRFLPPDQWAKVDVTPLGVDPKHFAPTPFRENPSPFTLLCVGRLCPAKGQYILLEVLQRLKEGGVM